MILIADSGSTKTDWCIVFNDAPIKRIGTKRNQSLLPIRRRDSTRADTFPFATTTGRNDQLRLFFMVQDALPKELPFSDGPLPTACP